MKGGRRTGAGRKRGSKTKKTSEVARRAAAEGISPLEFALRIMREPEPKPEKDEDPALFVARYVGWRDRAFEACKASLAYCHPRLNAIEHTGADGKPIQHVVAVEWRVVRPKS